MKQITLYGGTYGLRKVSLTKLLREEFDYSLSKAKSITDAVVANETVQLLCDDARCEGLAERLSELGVKISVGK